MQFEGEAFNVNQIV